MRIPSKIPLFHLTISHSWIQQIQPLVQLALLCPTSIDLLAPTLLSCLQSIRSFRLSIRSFHVPLFCTHSKPSGFHSFLFGNTDKLPALFPPLSSFCWKEPSIRPPFFRGRLPPIIPFPHIALLHSFFRRIVLALPCRPTFFSPCYESRSNFWNASSPAVSLPPLKHMLDRRSRGRLCDAGPTYSPSPSLSLWYPPLRAGLSLPTPLFLLVPSHRTVPNLELSPWSDDGSFMTFHSLTFSFFLVHPPLSPSLLFFLLCLKRISDFEENSCALKSLRPPPLSPADFLGRSGPSPLLLLSGTTFSEYKWLPFQAQPPLLRHPVFGPFSPFCELSYVATFSN